VLEYIGVKVFKSWKYDRLIFSLIGIGYGTFMVFVDSTIKLLNGNTSIFNILFLSGLLLISIFTKVYNKSIKG
jgi:hypothetical protein